MRLVSWNCNKVFREKYEVITELNADIYVIQECENPAKHVDTAYYQWAKNYSWISQGGYSGLGVFAGEDVKLNELDWISHYLTDFLPLRINDTFDLIAIWARKPHIEAIVPYLSIHFQKINSQTILLGDFNSNVKWDKKHGIRTHSTLNKMLSEKNLTSAYHHHLDEKYGEESIRTYYTNRKLEKSYHIDYCYCNPDRLLDMTIGNLESWKDSEEEKLIHSDHLPLIIDINEV